MHLTIGVVVVVVCALAPAALQRATTLWIAVAAAPFLLLMVAGAAFGLPFYPASDAVVLAFAILAGALLGRLLPPRFKPLLVLLAALSVLDVAQNVAFASSTPAATPTPVPPDSHLIWLNFWLPLPSGHFNIGVADLVLVAGIGENLRRRGLMLGWTPLPGVLAILLGEALLAALSEVYSLPVKALLASLVVFLLVGYVLVEAALWLAARASADAK